MKITRVYFATEEIEDKIKRRGAAATEADEATDNDVDAPPPDDEPEPDGEVIDESESEAAPKAV